MPRRGPDAARAAAHEARSPRLDSRVERSKRSVMAATVRLLDESGVGGFSIDEVVRRSGVAKTTIYRHWPDRNALVLDACSQLTEEQEIPDTGSLHGDLTATLTSIADLLETANWSAVLPSIIDAAERDPEFANVHSQIQRGHAAPLRKILERAADRGEAPPSGDHATIIAMLLGPLFYRRWFSREPIDREFIAAIVTRTIAACETDSSAGGELGLVPPSDGVD